MAVADANNSWEKIRRNVKDAEVLIGQKKYNLSMIKSRQALEGMVRSLSAKAAIAASDMASSIDELYSARWISKTSCEHYHKIRMLGNKAVHEGNDDAYDANQAYHLLSQEAYTFFHEYNKRKGGAGPSQSQPRRRAPTSASKSRRRQKNGRFAFSSYDIARLVFMALVIVLLFMLIRLLKPKKEEEDVPETTPVVTTEAPIPETTLAPETMAATTPAPVYKAADYLNVRSGPSTTAEKLGLLSVGARVEYVEDYDDEWAVIIYQGEEAYVASQFLVRD